MNHDPHRLPVSSAFLGKVHDTSRNVATRMAAGELPEYPLFVDRLFKQLPLIPAHKFNEVLRDSVDPADGALDLSAATERIRKLASDPKWSALHAAVGCAGEGGEILDVVKKAAMYDKDWHAENEEGVTLLLHLMEELGDFRFYYQKLLNMLGVTDTQVQDFNMAKLAVRYASGTYSDAQAQARADKSGRSYIGQERRK